MNYSGSIFFNNKILDSDSSSSLWLIKDVSHLTYCASHQQNKKVSKGQKLVIVAFSDVPDKLKVSITLSVFEDSLYLDSLLLV